MTVTTRSRRKQQIQTHPEAPNGVQGDEFKSGLTSQASFTTQSNLLDAQIRTQKLLGKEQQLRGEKAVVKKKTAWADRQEVLADTENVKVGIAKDNYAGTAKSREVNQDSIVQRLASRSYSNDIQRRKNDGTRQAILNVGEAPTTDHNSSFETVTGTKEG